MKRSFALAITLSLAMAAGCSLNPFSSDPLKQAREVKPRGTPFNQALYRAYLTRAEEKAQLGKRGDVRYFASRARAAGAGQAILPEDISKTRVDGAFGDLSAAHDNLEKLLVEKGRDTAPEESAQAQSFFDCWAKAAEVKDASEATRCKSSYDSGLTTLQAALNPAPQTDKPAQAEAQSGDKRGYAVYFGFDEWHLSAEALTTITESIDTARKEGQSEIHDAGYADTAGSAAYNMKLSKRRADVVREVMVQMGARGEAIKTEAHGEKDLAVPTADGVKEAKNRRVEITLVP